MFIVQNPFSSEQTVQRRTWLCVRVRYSNGSAKRALVRSPRLSRSLAARIERFCSMAHALVVTGVLAWRRENAIARAFTLNAPWQTSCNVCGPCGASMRPRASQRRRQPPNSRLGYSNETLARYLID